MRKFSADLTNVIGFFLFIFACALTAAAQNASTVNINNNAADKTVAAPAQTNAFSDAKNEFSVMGGYAPDLRAVYGGGRRSSFGFVAFRYSRHLIGSENVALKYTIDLIPAAFISYNKRIVVQTAPGTFVTQTPKANVYGFGLTPVGFQLNFRRKSKIQPFINANAGLIRFAKTIPDDRSALFPTRYGRQFNFTLAAGGGVEFLTENGKSFTAGFKFHHISNASTGNINPGFDQNLFYVGYTFKKW